MPTHLVRVNHAYDFIRQTTPAQALHPLSKASAQPTQDSDETFSFLSLLHGKKSTVKEKIRRERERRGKARTVHEEWVDGANLEILKAFVASFHVLAAD